MSNDKILVVEHREDVRCPLVEELGREGFDVAARDSVAGARVRCVGWPPDALVVGELERPGEGLAFVRSVRAGEHEVLDPGVAVVAFGGSGELACARAFEAGCDDFVADPTAHLELRTRLRAAVGCPRRPPGQRLRVGALTLDRRARTVIYRDRPVSLTGREFGLLARLAREPHGVVTRHELWREVWGCEPGPTSRTIDAHAARLRQKLRAAGAEPLVAARRGVGYSLLAPDAAAAWTDN